MEEDGGWGGEGGGKGLHCAKLSNLLLLSFFLLLFLTLNFVTSLKTLKL